MREIQRKRFTRIGVMAVCAVTMGGCPTSCPEPVELSGGVYMERVNCDQANECVIEDEIDMVTVEPDPQDATRFSFISVLRSLNGEGILCGARADYRATGPDRTEEGTMTFATDANTYQRVADTNVGGVPGACTGNASRVGPPGAPAAVGACLGPSGTGGTGGSGGSGGSGGCEPFSTDVGGSEAAPVVWQERYTCIDQSGACLGDENIEVVLELIQNAERIDWSIAEGTGQGSEFAGDLCGTSFRWSSKPETEAEDGCWEFTDTQFNKRSLGAGFFCVGSGSKGAGSTPAPLPTCAQIAAANVDFEACPLPPPASPIQGDPANCDGTVQVETMTSDITCTPPDPCDGCNEYCLANGFPYGSTEQSCPGFVCECGCTYCRPN